MQPYLHPHGSNSRGHCLSLCPNCLHSQTLSSLILDSSVLIFSPLLHLLTCLIEFLFHISHVTTSMTTPSLADTTILCSCPTRLDFSPHILRHPYITHPCLQTSSPWSLALNPPLSTPPLPWLSTSPVHVPPVHAPCVWTCRRWAHPRPLFTAAWWQYPPCSLPISCTP